MEPSNQKVAEGAPASFDCIAGIVFLKYFDKKNFYSNKYVSTWMCQIQMLLIHSIKNQLLSIIYIEIRKKNVILIHRSHFNEGCTAHPFEL